MPNQLQKTSVSDCALNSESTHSNRSLPPCSSSHLDVAVLLLEVASCPRDGASGAHPPDEEVHLAPRALPDLGTGSAVVHLRGRRELQVLRGVARCCAERCVKRGEILRAYLSYMQERIPVPSPRLNVKPIPPSAPLTSGLAGLVNCPSMNESGVAAAMSLALAMHPVMPFAGSVRTRVAPNALRRNVQTMTRWKDQEGTSHHACMLEQGGDPCIFGEVRD